MKKCLLFLAIFYTNFAYSQLHDSFNDGNFTSSPAWKGSETAFHVSSSGQLQSVKSDSSSAKYLVTSNQMATATSWDFYVELKFSPSSSNFARIYLISDQPDLNASLHGYYIRIGEDGSKDSYDLYKQDGASSKRIIKGIEGRANGTKVMVWIRINRSGDGTWTLFSKNSGESSYTTEGQATDLSPFLITRWFGIQCTFTKTRSDQFIFDDFNIGPLSNIPDTPGTKPPGGPAGTAIEPGDILISEVLFNPRGKGADFVEIYNHSNKVLNLDKLSLATVKKDSIAGTKAVTSVPLSFNPGSYMVLTTDPDNIRQEYHTENADAFLKMPSMPSYNNDAGVVILLADSERVDEFHYTDKMHSPLIKNPEGVSLERVSFDSPTNQADNFRSAAASVGYATPGYKNSQSLDSMSSADEGLFLPSGTFSPDNDGFEDALLINYHFKEPGRVANIVVYNDRGLPIRRLAKNMTLAAEGVIMWDGLDEQNAIPPVGIYIIYAEIFDLNGSIKKYRKPCVLAAKL